MTRRLLVGFVATLATYDVLRHAVITPRFSPWTNVAMIGVVAGFALAAHLTAAELGTARADVRRGLAWGGAAFAIVAVVLCIAAAVADGAFDDDRADVSAPAMLWRVLVVIPVATVALEELAFRGYGDFVRALDGIKEGSGTLLDNSIVLGFSDTGYAKIHSTDNIPMFIAGGGGGRHKGGQHVVGNGDPVSRVSLTAQQLIGMPVGQFGHGGMQTSKAASEVMI